VGRDIDPPSPSAQLWTDLRNFFEDESGYFAGGTVWFLDIQPEDVRRLWGHISVKATSIGEGPRIYYDDETDPDTPAPPDAFERLLAGDGIVAILPVLVGVRSGGEPLPDLFLELYSDAFGIYWWGRTPEGRLESHNCFCPCGAVGRAAGARAKRYLDLEHSDDPQELWRPVDDYLRSVRGSG
jgi:hypothetical protein